jgi:hypothetical protein
MKALLVAVAAFSLVVIAAVVPGVLAQVVRKGESKLARCWGRCDLAYESCLQKEDAQPRDRYGCWSLHAKCRSRCSNPHIFQIPEKMRKAVVID